MQNHDAVIAEQFGASPEEGFIETDADMLEHADRYDPVERAGNVAVIGEQEFCLPAQVLFPGTGVGDLQLFGRQRNAGHIGAGHLGQIEAEAAPARADVEDAVVAPDQELGGEVTLFGQLGIVERGIRRLEIGAAILLVGIEEEGIEPPVEIIVMSDVVSRPATPIELPDVAGQITQPPLQVAPAWYHFGLIEQNRQGVRNRAILDHECAVHIGFAQRQFGIEQDPPFGPPGPEPHRYRPSGTVAASKFCPARGRECHRAAANELSQEITQQTIHQSTNGTTGPLHHTHGGNHGSNVRQQHHNYDQPRPLLRCSQCGYSQK